VLSNSISRKDDKIAVQNGKLTPTATTQRVFVDSRMVHFSGIASQVYEVYTCNGRKIVQRRGSEMSDFLSHVPKGIYFIVDKYDDW